MAASFRELYLLSRDPLLLDIDSLDEAEKRRTRFAAKLRYEVDATVRVPALLETRLTEICGLQEAASRTT